MLRTLQRGASVANAARPYAGLWRFLSVKAGGIEVDDGLYDLIKNEIAPGTGVEPEKFWNSLDSILTEMVPKNKALLAERDEIQTKLNAYYKEHGSNVNMEEYKKFLLDIGTPRTQRAAHLMKHCAV